MVHDKTITPRRFAFAKFQGGFGPVQICAPFCRRRASAAYQMKQLRCDSIGWVRISPSKRSGSLIVGFDVAHEFATQVGHGCEDAAGDDVALDLGEPVFDLVEP